MKANQLDLPDFTMKLLALGVCVLLSCTPRAAPYRAELDSARTGRTIAFVNGRWFDGTEFRERPVYAADGFFVRSLASNPDTVIDLSGAYVVPPFADAHNHNVEFTNPTRTAALLAKYIREGVFYDQNPTNL